MEFNPHCDYSPILKDNAGLITESSHIFKTVTEIPNEAPVKMNSKLAAIFISRAGEMYNNGAALTPPMGWSSWNIFRQRIDENVILEIAEAVKKSGLADAGYVYINLDDCWQSSMRDENGKMQGDLSTFPHGIKWLVEQVNAMGLKLGIYSSNGTLTCEDLPASLYNERIDAETFAEWGIEYFKYDYCHHVLIPTDAPYIDSISIIGNSLDNEIVYKAKDAVLKGDAKVVEEKKEQTLETKTVEELIQKAKTIDRNNSVVTI